MKQNAVPRLIALGITLAASMPGWARQASPSPAAAPSAAVASPSPAATRSAAPSPAASAKPAATSSARPASPAASATPAAAPTPQVIVITQPAAAPPPPSNNWAAGILGLAILGVGGYFGLRYARGRGVTVADSLKKLGVEMPQDGMGGPQSVAHLKPPPPTVVLPPLSSLTDLPAPSGGALSAGTSVPLDRVAPRLVGVGGAVNGQSFALGKTAFTVGREADNALPLEGDTTVSRRHARVEPDSSGKGFRIVDEGSSNGTFVNGQRLPVGEARSLQSGDEVQIGAARLRFEG